MLCDLFTSINNLRHYSQLNKGKDNYLIHPGTSTNMQLNLLWEQVSNISRSKSFYKSSQLTPNVAGKVRIAISSLSSSIRETTIHISWALFHQTLTKRQVMTLNNWIPKIFQQLIILRR